MIFPELLLPLYHTLVWRVLFWWVLLHVKYELRKFEFSRPKCLLRHSARAGLHWRWIKIQNLIHMSKQKNRENIGCYDLSKSRYKSIFENGFDSEERFQRSSGMSSLLSDFVCSNLSMSKWACCLQRLSPKIGDLSDLPRTLRWTNSKCETWGNGRKVRMV